MDSKKIRLFQPEELKRIEAEVAQAELKTSGEIVTVVVRASGEYRWVRWVWATLGWCLATAILFAVTHRDLFPMGIGEIFLWQLFGAAVMSLAALWEPIIRLTLPAIWAARQVHREALANFAAVGLHQTRDHTGVLVYISEVERRVQILADRGIHQHANQEYWSEQVQTIIRGIRDGKAADGVCKAIREIGEKLATHYPPRPNDTNELSNEVRVGDQADRWSERMILARKTNLGLDVNLNLVLSFV